MYNDDVVQHKQHDRCCGGVCSQWGGRRGRQQQQQTDFKEKRVNKTIFCDAISESHEISLSSTLLEFFRDECVDVEEL